MSWKRVIVGSGTSGAILPEDLTTTGLSGSNEPTAADIGKVLKISTDTNSLGWHTDETIAHPVGFDVDNISINSTSPSSGSSTASGGHIISSLGINVAADGDGHITTATGDITTRELTLADLGYVGAHDANNFIHPEDGANSTATLTTGGALAANEVVTGISFSRTVDTYGHTTAHSNSLNTKHLDLSDLGYSGSAQADYYHSWNAQVNGGNGEDITSGGVVDFVAGEHIEIEQTGDSLGSTTITITGKPNALGTITSVVEGNGMLFDDMSGTNPQETINMATPLTLGTGSSNSAGGAGTGHEHLIDSTNDADANPDKILHADGQGYLKLRTLEVANSFTVNGEEVILGSTNLAIEDNSVQLNWDNANSDYFDGDSAIMFGQDYDNNGQAMGGKIVNKVDLGGAGVGSAFVFSDLTSADDVSNGDPTAGSTTVADANPKGLYTGPIMAAGSIFAKNVYAEGYVWSKDQLLTDSYLQFTAQDTAPTSPGDGTVYWSEGGDLWVYYA